MAKRVYKTAIYCRISKEDKDKPESSSIGGQRAYCEHYISKHDDLVITHEPFIDDGLTGTSFEREGFKALEQEIRSGKIDCIVVRDLSRFARNYIDAGRYLEKIFPSLGVRFIAINDNYDSLKSDPNSDAFVLPFKNLINDTYSKDISVKIRSSLDIKKKKGEYVGAFTPYGYLRDEADRHRLVVDEGAKDTVRLIFSLFKDGMSIGKIAERLNKIGILSPMEHKRSVGINFETVFKTSDIAKWDYNTVKRILCNDAYIGILTQGKRGRPNYKVREVRNKDESEWVTVRSSHEPLISLEDFVSINELLKRDMRSSTEEDGNTLSGFVFCGDCGGTMIRKTVTTKGKKYVYYICSNNKKNKVCTSHSIALNEIEANVLKAIKDQVEIVIDTKKAIDMMSDLKGSSGQHFCYEKQIATLNEEIEKYQKIKLRLYEDLSDKTISKEEYFEFKGAYSALIAERSDRIKRLEVECRQAVKMGTENKSWVTLFKTYEGIDTLSRRILLSLVDKIKIYEHRVIEVAFKFCDKYEDIVKYIYSLNQVEIA